MKFGRLDKRKGSGGPALTSRYAYLIHVADVAYFPEPDEKGVRLQGDVILHDDRQMMPIYLTNSSQEFSYETIGEDDEKTFKVEFQGTHPGTELEAMEFAKNFIEEPFIVLIPGCKPSEPWKLLGELTNPLIFVSNHKGNREGAKFNFTFEQAIGSEFIYFSYGGTVTPPDDPGTVDPPVNPGSGFDPTKWARIDASNIDPHIASWRAKLGITPNTFHTGDITTTANNVRLNLAPDGQNWAEISGTRYTRTVEQNFSYTPVPADKLKYLVLYALPSATVFYLAEGAAGTEAVMPDLPEGALFIASITVSNTGQIVNEAPESDYKYISEDGWVNIELQNDVNMLALGDNPAGTLDISVRGGGLELSIAGISAAPKLLWEGRMFWMRNKTGRDILLSTSTAEPELTRYSAVFFTAENIWKKDSWMALKIKQGALVVIQMGGGASFPEDGQRGDVLEWDAEGAVWTDRLTDAEAVGQMLTDELAAEIVTRAADDLNEKNARIATDLQEKNERVAGDAALQTQVTGNTNNITANTKSITDLSVHQITITTSTNITTNTLDALAPAGRAQNGRNVIINNGVNDIALTCSASSETNFVASYTKYGAAKISFVAGPGISIITTDGLVMDGGIGSSASLERIDNKYILKISNR